MLASGSFSGKSFTQKSGRILLEALAEAAASKLLFHMGLTGLDAKATSSNDQH